MNSLLKKVLVAAALGVLFFAPSTPANAQSPYWRNHWGWYDNTYRPYYHNYYGPNYYGGYGYSRPGYGPAYVAPYYHGYNSFYNGPGVYVAPGVGVHVGRANFGWW